jgi:phosphomannomutase
MAGIFKAYDIRGIVGDALNPQRAYKIGRGLASEIFNDDENREKPIVVSRDMRSHSPELAAALIRGLSEGGCHVLDVGLAATPMNYWANVQYGARGSVTVTASHNGPEYNGFKVSGAGATPLDFSTGLDKVEAYVLRAEAAESAEQGTPSATIGTVETIEDILTPYLDFMVGFVDAGEAHLKVGIDAANGMAGFFLAEFAKRLPWLEVVPLYWELDGTFPNHEADPLKAENLHDVEKLVQRERCDIGVAFDGDADRCMFVDENGLSISSDLVTALIAAHMLKQAPGSPILYDLRSSHIVPEWIERHGGVPVRGRVGHSFMKRLLKEQGAVFGGELSGHYYFRDCFNTDSGLMALIQLLNIWRPANAQGKTLSQLVAPLRRYAATGEINYHVADVAAVLQKIKAHYAAQGAQLDDLDGLTVELPTWWFNLRSSNTEPLLRLNLEAANAEEREAKLAEVQQLITS